LKKDLLWKSKKIKKGNLIANEAAVIFLFGNKPLKLDEFRGSYSIKFEKLYKGNKENIISINKKTVKTVEILWKEKSLLE